MWFIAAYATVITKCRCSPLMRPSSPGPRNAAGGRDAGSGASSARGAAQTRAESMAWRAARCCRLSLIRAALCSAGRDAIGCALPAHAPASSVRVGRVSSGVEQRFCKRLGPAHTDPSETSINKDFPYARCAPRATVCAPFCATFQSPRPVRDRERFLPLPYEPTHHPARRTCGSGRRFSHSPYAAHKPAGHSPSVPPQSGWQVTKPPVVA